MRDRLPYRLRGRRHWVEMLGVQRAEVNVCGIPFARSASRSSEWGESRRIGRGSRADAAENAVAEAAKTVRGLKCSGCEKNLRSTMWT